MKTITKYKAYNGTEFASCEDCEKYEARCKSADDAISILHRRPDSCAFSNGRGYIQHDPDVFKQVRIKLLELAKDETDHKWIQQSIDKNVDASYAGRIIGECCNNQLYSAWRRIECTDAQYREWGQQYYASHPSEADLQEAINGTF